MQTNRGARLSGRPVSFSAFVVALRRLPRSSPFCTSPLFPPPLRTTRCCREQVSAFASASLHATVVLRQAPARALAARRAGPLQHPHIGQLLLVRRQFRLRTRSAGAAYQQCRHVFSLPRFVWLCAICQPVYPFPPIPSSLFSCSRLAPQPSNLPTFQPSNIIFLAPNFRKFSAASRSGFPPAAA